MTETKPNEPKRDEPTTFEFEHVRTKTKSTTRLRISVRKLINITLVALSTGAVAEAIRQIWAALTNG